MSKLKEILEEVVKMEAISSINAHQVESGYKYIESIGNRLGIEHSGDYIALIRGIDDKLNELGFPQKGG
jgi:hypothetical protein